MDQFAARNRMRGQGGFTLIELLVVIAILAVLGGAVVIGIGSLRGSAQKEACKTDKSSVETAAEAYRVAENPATPGSVTVTDLVTKGYLKSKNSPANNFDLSYDTTTQDYSATPKGKYAGVTCT